MSVNPSATRVIVLGDSSAGKSALLQRFANNQFDTHTSSTIGMDILTRILTVHDQWEQKHHIILQLWDTAGQERFRSIVRNYYNGAHIAVFVYDCSSRDSFLHIARWLAELQEQVGQDSKLVRVLVGCKADLTQTESPATTTVLSDMKEPHPTWVKSSEAAIFAQQNNVMYLGETSASTGHRVNHVFTQIANLALERKIKLAAANAAITPTWSPEGAFDNIRIETPTSSTVNVCCFK